MKINLVQNGIFPILGNYSEDSTGYNINGTFQGEGKLIGTPCLFIRTSGCNLRCAWKGLDGKGSLCDTPYSSHKAETNIMQVEEIVDIVVKNSNDKKLKYIVVSGGEPTLQIKPLAELLKSLKEEGFHVTLETNGTLFSEDVSKYTDLISMSPKLSSSTPWKENLVDTGVKFNEKWANRHEKLRINIETIQGYINTRKNYGNDFQLKFVVTTDEDIKEIEEILNQLTGWESSDVCLMPEGQDVDTLNERTRWASREALKRGWRFTPRLHIMMFGKNRYV